uniref:Reverse transcriptase Ty1/copia-type domain-containing protein n=1 Tax=Tanacetum cinerariifolium TaxID=118510 RepID=A0A6L2KI40_TANCI|nr:hypothetical protein [Tanacetum cinerariifolium]
MNGDEPVQTTRDDNGVETEVPRKTAQAILARQRERKAKSILILAIPDEYQLRFHTIKDAESLWTAIKSRFGGNVESKKMQKTVLKQQFENFSVSDTEGPDKAYDRFQKLISLLEVHASLLLQRILCVVIYTVDGTLNQTKPLDLLVGSRLNSPQLDDEYLEKINHDDLEEMDLKWQVAMLSMRVKQFYKKTGRKLNFNSKELVVNKNRDERYRNRDNNKRTVPVESSNALVIQDNALIVQNGLGYDWSYIAHEEPTEFALMAYTSGSDTEEKITALEFEVKDKGNAITSITNQLDQILKEKEDLKAKLEQFEISSKNLNKLTNSQLSAKDKIGLGYGGQLSESNSEVLSSVFDSRSSDGDNNPVNDRFKKGDRYHAVPSPLTGNYMLPLANLSFAGLDDSVYRPTANKASASISKGEPSVIKTSNISVEMPKVDSVRTSGVIIQDWVSDDEDTLVDTQVDSQTTVKPSFKKIEFTKARNEFVKLDKQADKPKMVIQISKTTKHKFYETFRCLVTILNTLDPLGKFDRKAKEWFLVGYSVNNKAFRGIKLPKMQGHQEVNGYKSSDDKAGDNTAKDDAGKEKVQEPKYKQLAFLAMPMMKMTWKLTNHSYADESVGVEADFNNMESSTVVSPIPTTRVHSNHPKAQIIGDPMSAVQIREMQEELLQFKIQKVWTLVNLPYGKKAIGTKWVYQNKKDEKGIILRNKAKLMDAKSAFLYGTIKEEALYGLHQALRAWYETLSTYLLDNGFHRGQIDKTLFIKRLKVDILLVQVYVDDIIFGFTKKLLCDELEQIMHNRFQIEFNGRTYFLLGFTSPAKKDRNFINQDKYVGEILNKFGFFSVRSASTPMETHKPLTKDENGEDVDVHLYRSMIGSLMYLTSSRPDIMFSTKIHVDNESAICVIKNPVYHSKIKHIEIRHHFIRDSYEKRLTEMVKIHTDNNVADLLTKAFDVSRFNFLVATIAKVKKVNDVVRIQALVDGKRVNIKESSIRHILRLDDAECTSCLTNSKIFEGLARMGAKTTSWNEFSSTMASAIICLATNHKFNFLRYILLSLVKNIKAGVPFFMFPRFVQLIINHQQGILQADLQPILISTKPSTSKPQKKHNPKRKHTKEPKVPPTKSQAEHNVPLPSPSYDPLPSGEDSLKLKELIDLCTNLSNKVLALKSEVIDIKSTYKAKIEKLECRVERLKEENMVLKEVKGVHYIVESDEPIMEKEESSKQRRKIAVINANVEINLEKVQAEAYNLDLDHQEKVLSMLDVNDEEPVSVEEVVEVVTAANVAEETKVTFEVPKPRKRRGVIIQDIKETTTTVTVQLKVQAKDNEKVILIKEPKPLKRQVQIDLDEDVARQLEAELNADNNWNVMIEQVKRSKRLTDTIMKYQAINRKPLTEAQARRNMIVYLKNMVGYKMNYFKGISYDEIRPLSEKHYNYNQAFLNEVNEGIKVREKKIKQETEELNKHLQIIPDNDDDDDVYADATPLASKIPIVDYKIHTERNKPYFKIIRADGNYKLFLSFSTMMKNFDRDLESLWKIIRERFEKTNLKNYTDDYLLNTLKIMFENPNVEANVWKDQKGKYDLAKAKSWKLFDLCGVHCLNLSTTQMFLLVEKMYPLTHFTLKQMINDVRLKVNYESEMSLELLRLVRR